MKRSNIRMPAFNLPTFQLQAFHPLPFHTHLLSCQSHLCIWQVVPCQCLQRLQTYIICLCGQIKKHSIRMMFAMQRIFHTVLILACRTRTPTYHTFRVHLFYVVCRCVVRCVGFLCIFPQLDLSRGFLYNVLIPGVRSTPPRVPPGPAQGSPGSRNRKPETRNQHPESQTQIQTPETINQNPESRIQSP